MSSLTGRMKAGLRFHKPPPASVLAELRTAQQRARDSATPLPEAEARTTAPRRTKHFVTNRAELNEAIQTLRNGDTIALKPGVHFVGIDWVSDTVDITITVEAERPTSASGPMDDVRPIVETALPDALNKWRKYRDGMLERKDIPLSFMDDMAEAFHSTHTNLRRAMQRMGALKQQSDQRWRIIAWLAVALVVETLALARMSNGS